MLDSQAAEHGREPQDLLELGAPSDDGLSLDELSAAYAALLGKGADPYPDAEANAAVGNNGSASPAGTPLVEPEDEDSEAEFAVTPRSIVEAMLFVGHPTGEPLTSERIAGLMRGVRPAEIDDLVRDLNEEYVAQRAPYTIVSVGPGYQMVLRPELASLREAFHGRIREARLSQATIDVLAIVAYHQPISTEQVDRLRGRPSGAILNQLVRRDLLAVSRDPANRSKIQYRTTDRFLALFGLERLEELPKSHDLDRQL